MLVYKIFVTHFTHNHMNVPIHNNTKRDKFLNLSSTGISGCIYEITKNSVFKCLQLCVNLFSFNAMSRGVRINN